MVRTKVVATVGPASSSEEMLLELIAAGTDTFRLNMSHGDLDEKRALIRRIRELTKSGKAEPFCILGDLGGPKVRVGKLTGGKVKLEEGNTVFLTSDEITGDAGRIHVGYEKLGAGLKRGSRILIDDGMMELKVISPKAGEVQAKVVKGGMLLEHKGVNFPGMPLELPTMTEKDFEDLKLLVDEGVDYIALSFVRKASDPLMLKRKIAEIGSNIPVISKIERPEALREIKEIIKNSDAVMVARGDLGVEMPLEKVPFVQKRIIRLCHEMKKPVITATQMLESMIWNPRPTRAEASDVAGAVLDGTDALMLSGETASGKYPIEAALMMARIAANAENHLYNPAHYASEPGIPAEVIAISACRSADALGAKAIICFTRSGDTALHVSKYRPRTAIIAATPSESTFRRMRLYFGVIPMIVRQESNTDAMIREVERAALSRGLVKPGDAILVTLGVPCGSGTNLLKVHHVGQSWA
ncbi:MAG: pyruvate kinase [Nitrospirota bacterium]